MNYYNEHDPKAAAWLRELIKAGLIPAGDVDERSITDVKSTELVRYTQCHFFAGIAGWSLALQLAGWPADRPVWTGSCPCQPFSSAGKQLGTADERHLWPVFFNLINECRPVTVFGEQVASAIGKGWLDGVSADLERAGYACGATVLGAHSVGAPHIRQRLYWVANAQSQGRVGVEPERAAGIIIGARTGGDSPANNWGGLANSIKPGLEGHAGNGDDRDESRRDGSHEAGPVAESSGIGGVDNPASDGAERATAPEPGGNGAYDGLSGETGTTGGRLGDATTTRPEARESLHGELYREGFNEGRESCHWSAFDLTPCRDGKARRIESRFQLLVNGISDKLGGVREAGNEPVSKAQESELNYATKTEANTNPTLPKMQKATSAEAIPGGDIGGFNRFQEAEILRPGLHGSSYGRNDKDQEYQEQLQAIRETQQMGLREVRVEIQDARSPQGSESFKQRPIELGHLVRILPQIYSSAIHAGDTATITALQILFPASSPQRTVQHSLLKNAQAWNPPSREEVERAWTAGLFDGWGWKITHPLAVSEKGRVGLLRGYGNAIVPQIAAEFIKAFEEVAP